MSEKLLPFYQLLKQNDEPILKDDHHEALEKLREDLAQACKMSLRLPKPNAQYVIMADASFYSAGYVLLVEDYIRDQKDKEMKTYMPVSFGSKIFNPTFLKLSIYAKEFLAVHFAFDSFAHILWESTKPVLVLTDNRSLTRLFQAKTIPSSLWTCIDHVLTFNFILGHIPGKANLAADYLSRTHINPETKLQLKIQSKLPVCDVDVNLTLQAPDNSLTVIAPNFELMDLIYGQCSEHNSINALEQPNPLDEFDLTNKMEPLNLAVEQQQDQNIRTVMTWLKDGPPKNSDYLNVELKK